MNEECKKFEEHLETGWYSKFYRALCAPKPGTIIYLDTVEGDVCFIPRRVIWILQKFKSVADVDANFDPHRDIEPVTFLSFNLYTRKKSYPRVDYAGDDSVRFTILTGAGIKVIKLKDFGVYMSTLDKWFLPVAAISFAVVMAISIPDTIKTKKLSEPLEEFTKASLFVVTAVRKRIVRRYHERFSKHVR